MTIVTSRRSEAGSGNTGHVSKCLKQPVLTRQEPLLDIMTLGCQEQMCDYHDAVMVPQTLEGEKVLVEWTG